MNPVQLGEWARRFHVEHVRIEHGTIVEMRMHPTAWAEAGPPPSAEPPMLCACGHDAASEHNEAGCLHGCAHAECTSEPAKADE